MTIDTTQARPLSQWIMGRARIHFRSGHVVDQRMSRATAERLRLIIDNREGSDRLRWSDTTWLQFASEEVVMVDFNADPELGWTLTREERTKQAANGHPHGILTTLVDWWEDRDGPEPAYSLEAMALFDKALTDGVNGRVLDQLFEDFEGDAGATRLARRLREQEAPAGTSEEPEPGSRPGGQSQAQPATNTRAPDVPTPNVPSLDDLTVVAPEEASDATGDETGDAAADEGDERVDEAEDNSERGETHTASEEDDGTTADAPDDSRGRRPGPGTADDAD